MLCFNIDDRRDHEVFGLLHFVSKTKNYSNHTMKIWLVRLLYHEDAKQECFFTKTGKYKPRVDCSVRVDH